MLCCEGKHKIKEMAKRDRSNLVAVEVSLSMANYLKQRYGVKTPTEAVRRALDDFSQIPDLVEAQKYDHDKCLAVSDETKVRLMQAMNYPDWRFAALHIISDYLYDHNARQSRKTEDNTDLKAEENV